MTANTSGALAPVNKSRQIAGFGMIPRWFVFDTVHDFRQIALFAYMSSRRSVSSRVWVQLERLSSALCVTPNTARSMLREACEGSEPWLERESTVRGDPRGTCYRFTVGRTGKPEKSDSEQIAELKAEIRYLKRQLDERSPAETAVGPTLTKGTPQAQNSNPLLYSKGKEEFTPPYPPASGGHKLTRATKKRITRAQQLMIGTTTVETMSPNRSSLHPEAVKVWSQVRDRLIADMGASFVVSWLDPCEVSSFELNELQLTCPDAYALHYLSDNAGHQIEEAVAAITGQACSLSLTMATPSTMTVEIDHCCDRCGCRVNPSTGIFTGILTRSARELADNNPSVIDSPVDVPGWLCITCAEPHDVVNAELEAKGRV